MADGLELNSGSGGATLAADDISGTHWQMIKLAYGALDSATLVTTSAPLPVDIRAENASVTVDNSGTFAVQVDGDALTALQLIDNLVLAEDSAHSSTDPGVQMLAVRKATPADLSGTDGDYEPLQMDNGKLWVNASGETLTVGSHAVTNAGTFAVQVDGDALTALQLIDNAVHVDDAGFTLGTHSGVMMMGFAGTQSVDANDAGAIAMETDGAVHIHDGGNTITVDGTVTANLSGTDNAVLDTIDAVLDNIKIDTEAIETAVEGTLTVDATGQGDVPVTLDSEAVVLGAGTAEIGSLLPPDTDVTAHSNYARKYYTAATPTDGIVWSPAAGTRWHVQALYFNVSAAATVTFEDDKTGGDDPVLKGEFAANSGLAITFPEQYPMASGEDAADLTVTVSAGTIYVTVVGYEI